jgi:hypothetical protein
MTLFGWGEPGFKLSGCGVERGSYEGDYEGSDEKYQDPGPSTGNLRQLTFARADSITAGRANMKLADGGRCNPCPCRRHLSPFGFVRAWGSSRHACDKLRVTIPYVMPSSEVIEAGPRYVLNWNPSRNSNCRCRLWPWLSPSFTVHPSSINWLGREKPSNFRSNLQYSTSEN